MATLIILGVVLLVLVFSVSRASRRQREELEERRRQEAEIARGGGGTGSPGFSPFAGLPFGGLFDQLLRGPGTWSRSLELDPETDEWVDVTNRGMEAEPSEHPPGTDSTAAPVPPPRRTQAASPGPFGGLFGSLGGMSRPSRCG
ncbi:MAG: hypothetical protein M3355_01325 [Actinomycetota bacterium]|nr:hypothetical protein [Actinomycetota bacterium]